MKKKTILIISGIVVVVIVLVGFLLWRTGGKSGRMFYETQTLTKGDMENSVTATGTIEPMEQVEVGTQVSGIIDKIYVDYNSRVEKGQVIAELDKTVLQADLETARLTVQSNKNEFLYQEKNYNRNKQLYEKNLLSPSEFETAEYNYRKAKIAYEQSMAQETKARTNLGYATIYSPIDGVVISKSVEVGQTVASSFSTPTLFTIVNDLHSIQVVANVDEADIGQVSEGAQVSFSVDAYPEETFEGKVNQVRMEAITNNNVVTYEVVIYAENPELKLKPGMTANINIYSMRKKGVLRLPVKATRFRPMPAGGDFHPERSGKDTAMMAGQGRGGRFLNADTAEDIKMVFVMMPSDNAREAMPQPRKVRVGVSDRIYYEVLEGLQEGENVCVGISASAGEVSGNSMQRSPFMPGPPGNRGGRK